MSRPSRTRPRDAFPAWPDASGGDDPIADVARRFAVNLRAQMGARSLREIAAVTGVHHATIAVVLDGAAWPDLSTIAKLEHGLEADLWPGRAH